MGADTKIQWCDFTFNPWEGCTKVSPGCLNCYAETRNARFGGGTPPNWGKGKPRRLTSDKNWNEPVRWNRAAAEAMNEYEKHKTLHGGIPQYSEPRRPRVFCASLADWLDDEVPITWFKNLLFLIYSTPFLDWLLLTKRPENWRKRMDQMRLDRSGLFEAWLLEWYMAGGQLLGGACDGEICEAPANVWFGVSAESQEWLNRRISDFINVPARVRFVSFEPLIGPAFLPREISRTTDFLGNGDVITRVVKTSEKIHWAIMGGESGFDGTRPCNIDWIRELVAQCRSIGVTPFVKQLGSRPYSLQKPVDVQHHSLLNMYVPPVWEHHLQLEDKKGGEITEWPEDLRIREFPQ